MVHYNYYLDLTVDAFIVNKNAVLLRLHDKYNFWGGAGGHIDPGEDANEAVLREVWEEVGLEVTLVGPPHWSKKDTHTNKDLVPPLFVNRHRINNTHSYSSFIFAAQSSSRDVQPQLEEDKSTEWVWVTKQELKELFKSDERLHEDVYRYARTALELVS